jgi:isoquinoline 1-oxidoreductase subunit beta
MQQNNTTIHRRKFLKLSGITGTGLIIGLNSGLANTIAVSGFPEAADVYEFTPLINIEKSGKIFLFNTRPEIGQGTFQAVPSMIAEELEVSLDQVTIVQTGGEKKFGGTQWVGGSSSVRSGYGELRKAGAAAKEMLQKAAAANWNVPVDECYAENGKIFHKPSGKNSTYGELAEAASKLELPASPKLKDPTNFKMLGKATPRPDVPLKSSGRAIFGIDASTPGMVYASIARCPVMGSKLLSFDDSATKNIKGVLQVVKSERVVGIYRYETIAVIAENYWAALQGRKALKINWDFQGRETFNSKNFEAKLRSLASQEGLLDHSQGDFEKTFSSSPIKLESFYETPFVSHSPIEPMNCLAAWTEGNKLEIWTSTQVPGDVVSGTAKEFGIPEENIKLHTLFNGGAFGRRLINDYIYEAVDISKKIKKPVKVIWTREDDTQQGPFRPLTFSAMKAGLSADGKAIAFQHKVIAPSLEATLEKNHDKTKVNKTMTEAISEQKYEIPNMKNSYVAAEFDIPLLYWRAVTSTTLAFAHECFIDEMAVKAKKDPLDYRLEMIKKSSDAEKVLRKLKEVSSWNKALPTGWGRGVAQYEFFAGLCGQVVEVSKKGNGIKIEKVYAVIDMGTVVNPDTVKGQVEGAIVMAISAAIKSGITFDKGQTVQTNFHNNPILRINEMPLVEVHIIADGGEVIKGAGEPGLPPTAPALCNAIFAATGKRIRRLPFDINNI